MDRFSHVKQDHFALLTIVRRAMQDKLIGMLLANVLAKHMTISVNAQVATIMVRFRPPFIDMSTFFALFIVVRAIFKLHLS